MSHATYNFVNFSILLWFTGLDGIINYESFPAGIEFLTPSLPYYHEFETDSDEEIFSKDLVHLWTTFAAHQYVE